MRDSRGSSRICLPHVAFRAGAHVPKASPSLAIGPCRIGRLRRGGGGFSNHFDPVHLERSSLVGPDEFGG
jgi:hypothetical protein